MKEINVKKRNGRLEPLNIDKINKCVERACEGLEDVSASEVVIDSQVQLYDKITTKEIDQAMVLSARAKAEKEPNYSYVAARLLLNILYKEVFGEGVDHDAFEHQYRASFIRSIKQLVKAERLSPGMEKVFDLKKLAEALVIDRDYKFKYLGLQTLYDRYFLHIEGRRMESPQGFWMRVAMGVALNEADPTTAAIEFYHLFSELRYCPSTPTLFNSGTVRSQLSSCYLSVFDDNLDSIFDTYWQEARKSKYAGGLGASATRIRSTNAWIKGTNGPSGGLIPWLNIYNALLSAVNQGGKRPGAGCIYLENWHGDYEPFLDLRKNTGEERLRAHDLNTATWISDYFMVLKNDPEADWYLFNPSECPELHETFGQEFITAYKQRVEEAKAGLIKNFQVVKAKDLARKMYRAIYETGHPWFTFKDPSNIRYSDQHLGVVHNSNLCTEIIRHTIASIYDPEYGEKKWIGETAVCNLGSINFKAHFDELGRLDLGKLRHTIIIAVRILDNVVDLNYYPTAEAKNSNLRHRPIGLGSMGWHDLLHSYGIAYSSEEAVELCDQVQEFISWVAIGASADLAEERGSYQTFSGSLWSKGELPLETFKALKKYRKEVIGVDTPVSEESRYDWEPLRERVKKGMRNGSVMAIAPTATIASIVGCSQSIDPNYSVLYVYETKSGNFLVVDEWFVREIKAIGLWNQGFIDALKAVDGDVSQLNIPDSLKKRFCTAFDQDQKILIQCGARRQKWIDQAQSLNLFNKGQSLAALDQMYSYAWECGLKTTYYLRNRSASKIEKVSVSTKKVEETSEEEMVACSVLNPECESCQ